MMERGGSIYILTNKYNTTLYIGVTSNLLDRINEHRNRKHPDSFSAKYNLSKLLYHESFHDIEEAIIREKRIKGWVRRKKEELINSLNPDWKDLFDEL